MGWSLYSTEYQSARVSGLSSELALPTPTPTSASVSTQYPGGGGGTLSLVGKKCVGGGGANSYEGTGTAVLYTSPFSLL